MWCSCSVLCGGDDTPILYRAGTYLGLVHQPPSDGSLTLPNFDVVFNRIKTNTLVKQAAGFSCSEWT